MGPEVFKIRRQWFIDDLPMTPYAHSFFRCACPSCPYSVAMNLVFVNGRRTYQVDHIVFDQHCHVFEKNKRRETKSIVQAEIDLIRCGLDVDNVLDEKHKRWQQEAEVDGQELKEKLLKQETAITMAVEHPDVSGRVIQNASDNALDKRAITMARKRKMEKDDHSLQKITESKKHHLLTNFREEILIFGDDLAVQRLASTNVIHADGTFKCKLKGFSQLYIFHATVQNNLSLPVLFCLVKGKNAQTYARLLGMVEELATDADLTVFNREVTLMCDFELSFINAVRERFVLVTVRCCFFHFVQSIRKNAKKKITAIKKAAGQNSEKVWMAMRTVRRIMMLPLVPQELVTPELVQLIIAASTDGSAPIPRELKALQIYVLTTYVGKRRARSGPVITPRSPRRSGM